MLRRLQIRKDVYLLSFRLIISEYLSIARSFLSRIKLYHDLRINLIIKTLL